MKHDTRWKNYILVQAYFGNHRRTEPRSSGSGKHKSAKPTCAETSVPKNCELLGWTRALIFAHNLKVLKNWSKRQNRFGKWYFGRFIWCLANEMVFQSDKCLKSSDVVMMSFCNTRHCMWAMFTTSYILVFIICFCRMWVQSPFVRSTSTWIWVLNRGPAGTVPCVKIHRQVSNYALCSLLDVLITEANKIDKKNNNLPRRSQWRMQDFIEGVPTYYLTIFFLKLHKSEEILVERRGACVPCAPSPRFDNGLDIVSFRGSFNLWNKKN